MRSRTTRLIHIYSLEMIIMSQHMQEIKKKYDEISRKLDESEYLKVQLKNGFTDGAKGDEIKHDMNLKSGSGAEAKPKMGEVLDGAKGGDIDAYPKGRSGSGASTEIPKVAQAPMVDGAQKTDIAPYSGKNK